MKIYAIALVVLWCVPITALVVLFTFGGLLLDLVGEEVFAAVYFALFLGAPIATVLTLIVVPTIALGRWVDRAERQDGSHRGGTVRPTE